MVRRGAHLIPRRPGFVGAPIRPHRVLALLDQLHRDGFIVTEYIEGEAWVDGPRLRAPLEGDAVPVLTVPFYRPLDVPELAEGVVRAQEGVFLPCCV